MPRGAKDLKSCSLAILTPGAPKINLIRQRRTKGWWPFRGVEDGSSASVMTGKLEAEFMILTEEEAAQNPAGLGRNEPNALPEPNRPDTSFSWFLNPWKAIKYVTCKLHRWKIIRCFCCILLILFIGLTIYATPGYLVKKVLRA